MYECINSGIINKLYATLVDGGNFEHSASEAIFIVNKIGMTKAINLMWQVWMHTRILFLIFIQLSTRSNLHDSSFHISNFIKYNNTQLQNVMTPTSTFIDFGNLLIDVCEQNIDVHFFIPDVFNGSSVRSSSPLNKTDCANVASAIEATGILRDLEEYCTLPPIDPHDGKLICDLSERFNSTFVNIYNYTCVKGMPVMDPCVHLGAWGLHFQWCGL